MAFMAVKFFLVGLCVSFSFGNDERRRFMNGFFNRMNLLRPYHPGQLDAEDVGLLEDEPSQITINGKVYYAVHRHHNTQGAFRGKRSNDENKTLNCPEKSWLIFEKDSWKCGEMFLFFTFAA